MRINDYKYYTFQYLCLSYIRKRNVVPCLLNLYILSVSKIQKKTASAGYREVFLYEDNRSIICLPEKAVPTTYRLYNDFFQFRILLNQGFLGTETCKQCFLVIFAPRGSFTCKAKPSAAKWRGSRSACPLTDRRGLTSWKWKTASAPLADGWRAWPSNGKTLKRSSNTTTAKARCSTSTRRIGATKPTTAKACSPAPTSSVCTIV